MDGSSLIATSIECRLKKWKNNENRQLVLVREKLFFKDYSTNSRELKKLRLLHFPLCQKI